MNKWVFCLVVASGAVAVGTRASAQPEFKEVTSLRGHIARPDGTAAAGAAVTVYWRGHSVGQTQTDAKGEFVLPALPAQKPGPWSWVVVATAAPGANGAETATALVAPRDASGDDFADAPALQMVLRPLQPLRWKVTSTQAEPLPGARVVVNEVYLAASENGTRQTLPWKTPETVTGADGTALMPEGLPADAWAKITLKKNEFADSVAVVRPRPADREGVQTLTFVLAREAVVWGRVTLGGKEPLAIPQWRMKMQGWRSPWNADWRTSYLDSKGFYMIRNVTSIEVLGEATYGINLDFERKTQPVKGITGSHVPPGAGWDAMVTVERNGQTERYIGYVAALKNGLVYEEGAEVIFNYDLEPMALIQGRAPSGTAVSYRNSKSIYGPWEVVADEQGRFEIPVPTGTVELRVGTRTIKVENLVAQETRVLETL